MKGKAKAKLFRPRTGPRMLTPELRARLEEMGAITPGRNVKKELAVLDERIKKAELHEKRALDSERALKAAIAASRNDERSRVLKAENERQYRLILAMQAELDEMRGESRQNIGWDKARYFAFLGKNLSDMAKDVQTMGERLSVSADAITRSHAGKLEEIGEAIGDFADNAIAYGEEALEKQAKENGK